MARTEQKHTFTPEQTEQYAEVGRLLSQGKVAEATALLHKAQQLKDEAKQDLSDVGKLLASGDLTAATRILFSSQGKEREAQSLLQGEAGSTETRVSQSVQKMIEASQKSETAFSPHEIQYLSSVLAKSEGLLPDDVDAFSGVSGLLQHEGFMEQIEPDDLELKIRNGFEDIETFYDSQTPEGQLIVAALMPHMSDLSNLLS